MKVYKPKKALKNSRQVAEFFEGKEDGLLVGYKGGVARVESGRVSKIYVGADALKSAKLNK